MNRNIRKVWTGVMIVGLLVTGCTTVPASATAPTTGSVPGAEQSLTQRIDQQIKAGASLIESKPVDFALPTAVVQEQIRKYFQLGDLSFALVLQPSLNVPFVLPPNYTPTFTGVLISDNGAPWQKYLTIQDQQATARNNPYYLWTDAGALYLAVVDQLGAGSGEGNMKLLRLTADETWQEVACYYFGGNYGGPDRDGDYLAFAQQLQRQQTQADHLCDNVAIELW